MGLGVSKSFPGWRGFKYLQVFRGGGDKRLLIPCSKQKYACTYVCIYVFIFFETGFLLVLAVLELGL